MPRLACWAQAAHRSRHVDLAKLFGPQIVFRHERETTERANPARRRNCPSGLLQDLPVKRLQRCFARINATARKLELGERRTLQRQEQVAASGKKRVDAAPELVAPVLQGWSSETSVHLSLRAGLVA